MNERQLHSFILAAEYRSFSKAANESFISTPALVQQINALEHSLDFKLFLRTKQGVYLTPPGEVFYTASKQIMAIYEEAQRKGKELQDASENTLTIAHPVEQFPSFLFEAYAAFCNKFPKVNVVFSLKSFSEQVKAIRSGEADLCVIAEPTSDYLQDISFTPLLDDTFSFCMREDHPLSGKESLTAEDLLPYTVLCGDYPYMKHSFYKTLSSEGINCQLLNKEYDISIRAGIRLKDNMFVINSPWTSQYEVGLSVIPSNINAGPVGILHNNQPSRPALEFITILQSLF